MMSNGYMKASYSASALAEVAAKVTADETAVIDNSEATVFTSAAASEETIVATAAADSTAPPTTVVITAAVKTPPASAASTAAAPCSTAAVSADDQSEFPEIRRHGNGCLRNTVRPFSLQDERILDKSRNDRLTHIEEGSTEVLTGGDTDAGRPLIVPPRRSKSALNGRLSSSVQMLNGEGTKPSGVGDCAPSGTMGSGGKVPLRPPTKSTSPGTIGEDLGASTPSETFLRIDENSVSAISNIPSNSTANVLRYRNHINSVNSSSLNTSIDQSTSIDRGVENSPAGTLRQNDKGIQISTVPKAAKAQKGRFVKVFPEIAEVDMVIKSYHCALVGDILLQGFLYVTSKWFCFHSKLMGKKRIAIPVSKVTNISKKKTAIIIPNAISITTAKEKFLFGSLMSRDNTFDLMLDVWKQNQENSQDLEDADPNGDQTGGEEQMLSKSMTSTQTNSSEDSVTLGSSSSDSYTSVGPPSRQLSAAAATATGAVEGTCRAGTASGALCTCSRHTTPRHSTGSNHLQAARARGYSTGHASTLGSAIKNPLNSWNEIMAWIKSLPRNYVILSISTILVIFLLFSALLLAYKLIQLQTNIRPVGGWATYPPRHHFAPHAPSARTSTSSSSTAQSGDRPSSAGDSTAGGTIGGMEEELLYRRQEYHFTAIERINTVLESHIHMLDQINEAMRSLKQIAASSPSSSSCHQASSSSTSSNHLTSSDDSTSSVISEALTNEQHEEL